MTKRTFSSILFLLILTTMLTAQSDPSLSTTGDEVVVTGTRVPKSLAETTTKVTVIDSATIARSFDLGQLLNEQAGIVVNGAYSAPGKDRSLFLRNGANQYTLILLDGQPLVDPSSLGGAVDLRLLDLQRIQRIEIVRGAQSLIYGSDAVAGVINLISKKDQASGPVFDLLATAGSYDTYEGAANLRGSTTSGKLSYSLGVNYLEAEGFSEAGLSPAVLQNPLIDPLLENDGILRLNANAALTYRAGEHWTIRPALRYASFDGDFDDGAFRDNANNTYENEMLNPSLAIDYKKAGYAAGLRYTHVSTDRLFDSTFGESLFEGRAQQADAFAHKQYDNLALTLGAQTRIESLTQDMPPADADDNVITVSPYLQATYGAGQPWFGEAAVRYNVHSVFGGQLNYSTGFGYRVLPELTLKGSLASAFQSPTLDQLYGPFGANPDLDPQTSTSIELGIAFAQADGMRSFSITGFQRSVDDVILFGNPGYKNQGELNDLGVELEGAVQLTDHFHVMSNLTYVEGELKSEDAAGNPTVMDEFFRRPRLSGMVGLTYTPSFPLTARLTGNYTGERPDVFFDADFNRFEVDLDPYLLINLYVEYKVLFKKNLTLFIDARNLTSEDFVEVTGFQTQGATYRTGVRFTVGQ